MKAVFTDVNKFIDIRVRSNPSDAFSAGSHYFDLFLRLRALPGADRPTLYGVQAVLLAAVYAIGRGKLSKGLALLSEAITLSIDAGLHRSVEHWDHFDPIETEVRKRTFWSGACAINCSRTSIDIVLERV